MVSPFTKKSKEPTSPLGATCAVAIMSALGDKREWTPDHVREKGLCPRLPPTRFSCGSCVLNSRGLRCDHNVVHSRRGCELRHARSQNLQNPPERPSSTNKGKHDLQVSGSDEDLEALLRYELME